MTVLLALAAGVVTAIASWLILRSGERDQDRIERSLGVARARAPRARISVARLADAAGVLAPEGLVASLGGFPPHLGPPPPSPIPPPTPALRPPAPPPAF